MTSSKQAYVVMGMHRSGTSALSRAISLLGPAQPIDLMRPREDNPLGFWESASVVALNDEIMVDLGIAWDRPLTFLVSGLDITDSRAEVQRLLRDKYLVRTVSVLETSYAGQSSIVLKDPRICLFPELWAEALSRAGYIANFIVTFRNPLEVAQSLLQRNGINRAKAEQMWLRYILSALSLPSFQQKGKVLSFEALLNSRGALVHSLIPDAPAADREAGLTAVAMVDTYLQPNLRHEIASDDALWQSPYISNLTKQVYAQLLVWTETGQSARIAAVETYVRSYDDFARLAGALSQVDSSNLKRTVPNRTERIRLNTSSRLVIVHYHLFKNAGTSVDAILKENFGKRWRNVEFPPARVSDHQTAIREFIASHPELRAISSHTLAMPPPMIEDTEVFPIVFVREPLKRLKSAYSFERQQQLDTLGANLAKQTDFAGYVRARLAIPGDRSCRNFQTYRLAMATSGQFGDERTRAIEALTRLPFVGLVEAFGKSIAILKRHLRLRLPEFRSTEVWANATERVDDPANEQQAIRQELGPELYDVVLRENSADMELFEILRDRYEAAL